MDGVNIHFEDTQKIQALQDKCLQGAHQLRSDEAVLRRVERAFELLPQDADSKSRHESYILQDFLTEVNLEKQRIESIVQRLNATIALVRQFSICKRSDD